MKIVYNLNYQLILVPFKDRYIMQQVSILGMKLVASPNIKSFVISNTVLEGWQGKNINKVIVSGEMFVWDYRIHCILRPPFTTGTPLNHIITGTLKLNSQKDDEKLYTRVLKHSIYGKIKLRF